MASKPLRTPLPLFPMITCYVTHISVAVRLLVTDNNKCYNNE